MRAGLAVFALLLAFVIGRTTVTPATAVDPLAVFPWHVAYPQILDDLGNEVCYVPPTDSVHDRGPELAAFIADAVNEAARRGRRP